MFADDDVFGAGLTPPGDENGDAPRRTAEQVAADQDAETESESVPADVARGEGDSYPEVDETALEEALAEDDQAAFHEEARELAQPPAAAAQREAEPDDTGAARGLAATVDEGGDASAIDETLVTETDMAVPLRWDPVLSAHAIAVQLKHIEGEVRRILDPVDDKRKRKLNGTRRWQELEDDIQHWRFGDRVPEPDLLQLRQLINRRHSLFQRLNFLSGTRPTWNS